MSLSREDGRDDEAWLCSLPFKRRAGSRSSHSKSNQFTCMYDRKAAIKSCRQPIATSAAAQMQHSSQRLLLPYTQLRRRTGAWRPGTAPVGTAGEVLKPSLTADQPSPISHGGAAATAEPGAAAAPPAPPGMGMGIGNPGGCATGGGNATCCRAWKTTRGRELTSTCTT